MEEMRIEKKVSAANWNETRRSDDGGNILGD